MRILLVSLHTSPLSAPGSGDAGGLNVVVAETARGLAAAGHEVSIATRRDRAEVPDRVSLPGGVTVLTLEAGPLALEKGQLPAIVPAFSAALAALPPADIVHSHYWLSGAAAAPVAAGWAAPHAVSLHTVAAQKNAALAPGDRPEPLARLAAERALVHGAAPVAGSGSEAAAIVAGYDVAAERIAVVTPGVDTERFRPVPVAARRLAVLGRVQPLKGQDLAIRALARTAVAAGEEPLRLVIAGDPSPGHERYASGLRALAADLGVAERVEFLPALDRDAAARLLAGSALSLVPSHSETFGLVALESAACGTPALTPDHSGFRESVAHGVSGIRLPDREPGTWAGAIDDLLADPGALGSLRRSARGYALQHRWADTAARLLEHYGELLARGASRG